MDINIGEVCILVKDLDEAAKFYRTVLGLEPTQRYEENRGTPGAYKAIDYNFNGVVLTLMAPTGEDSTILNHKLEKRGEGIDHFCFFVDEMDTVIKRCNDAGIRLVDSWNEPVKRGGDNGYTDPRATHRTMIQFRPKGAREAHGGI
ncbi:MAG: VOC family protein [Dehalococcoidales bacterium]|nr:VOC family protein [Dehalococcoidales bacterium]